MRRALAVLLSLAGGAQAQGTAGVAAIWVAGEPAITVAGDTHAGGRPVTEADAWHIGSMTKAMTATLAGRLVARGVLDWDTPVESLLDAAPPWHGVTLAQLLTHRSGMAANPSRLVLLRRPDRATYVGQMLRCRPAAARGAFLYSNAGYTVAGAMLQAATGRTWEDLIGADVWGPLGMQGMGFGAPNGIWGHAPAPWPPGPKADNIPAMAPAGTVHAPPAAMLRFLAAHATRDPAFLPPEVWERLQAPIGDYAMGWSVQGGTLQHAGTNTAWLAQMAIRGDRAVFVAVNGYGTAAEAAVRSATQAAMTVAPPAMPKAPRP